MDSIPRAEKLVSVVIPAFNEAPRVGAVVRRAAAHPLVGEVIVVDDGSFDTTVSEARRAGARVITHVYNQGKAGAMHTGVKVARHDILFFIDADVHGLTHGMMNKALEGVIANEVDMFVLVIDRVRWIPRIISDHLPLLSGIRVMRRRVWQCVPSRYRRSFGIETALNYFANRHGYRVRARVMEGLRHVVKEKKRGLWAGFTQRMRMIVDISRAILTLHFVHPTMETLVTSEELRALGIVPGKLPAGSK